MVRVISRSVALNTRITITTRDWLRVDRSFQADRSLLFGAVLPQMAHAAT